MRMPRLNIINKSKLSIILAMGVCAGLSLLDSLSIISVPIAALAIVYVLAFSILNSRNKALLYLSLVPVSGGTMLYVLHSIMFASLVIKWILSRTRYTLKFNQAGLALALALGYVITRELLAIPQSGQSYFILFGLVICVINLYIILQTYGKDTDFLRAALIGWSIAVILLTANMAILQANVGGFTSGDVRLGSPVALLSYNRTEILWQDPNYLGIYISIAITGLVVTFRSFKKKSIPAFILAILLICGLATTSRGFLFSMLLLTGFLWLSSDIIKKVKFLLILPFILLLAISVLGEFGAHLYDTYADRFAEADISNGRFELYQEYGNIATSNYTNLLFGIGLIDYPSRASELVGAEMLMVHNSLLEIFVAWGVIGATIILMLVIMLSRSIVSKMKKPRQKIYALMPLILFITPTLTLTIFYSYYSILPVFFFVASTMLYIQQSTTPKYLEGVN